MEAKNTPKRPGTVYQTTRDNVPKDNNLHVSTREDLKYRELYFLFFELRFV